MRIVMAMLITVAVFLYTPVVAMAASADEGEGHDTISLVTRMIELSGKVERGMVYSQYGDCHNSFQIEVSVYKEKYPQAKFIKEILKAAATYNDIKQIWQAKAVNDHEIVSAELQEYLKDQYPGVEALVIKGDGECWDARNTIALINKYNFRKLKELEDKVKKEYQ